MKSINIALVESYYGGSHKFWADHLVERLPYTLILFSLPARHWKWRMQGSAPVLAQQILAHEIEFDLFIVSDMIDLAFFKALISDKYPNTPCIYYMHENQLTYPLSSRDKEKHFDLSYGYLNYKSCMIADLILFNSNYHFKVFIEACRSILLKMPELNNLETLKRITRKSKVIPVGLDLNILDDLKKKKNSVKHHPPSILWNHRWDDDKNPQYFLDLINFLNQRNLEFTLVFSSQNRSSNEYVKYLNKYFKNRIINNTYINDYKDYLSLISQCSLMPVSPGHDFFGLSVLEAIYMGVTPLLPFGYVYEEHFDISTNRSIFYENKQEYFEKSIDHIEGRLNLDQTGLEESIKRYHIKNLIPEYIRIIESML